MTCHTMMTCYGIARLRDCEFGLNVIVTSNGRISIRDSARCATRADGCRKSVPVLRSTLGTVVYIHVEVLVHVDLVAT